MASRNSLFLIGVLGGLSSAAAQEKSFSCTTIINADLTNGFSQTTAKVLKGGDGCLINLLSGEFGTNIAVYQDTSDNNDCGDYDLLNRDTNYLGAESPIFEDPTVLCIVNTDNNAIIDTNKMLTVNLVEDGEPGNQPDNTMQAYTSNGFDETTGYEAKTADGTCRTLTWPAADVAGGLTTLAVNFDCTNPQDPNVKAGTNVDACNDNQLGGALNYFHEYGAYQYEPAGNQPVFFYVKCSAAGGVVADDLGDGVALEDAEADATEAEDLSVESESDDSSETAAIVGGSIGGAAVLGIAMVLWYRSIPAVPYKLVPTP